MAFAPESEVLGRSQYGSRPGPITCTYQRENLNTVMWTISSIFSTFSQYFFLRLASLFPSKYNNLMSAEKEPKFDWANWRERDTTNEWDKCSPFLESHGVFLLGTEAYFKTPLPPSSPALSPFLPTPDEDFVYRLMPYTVRRKFFYSYVRASF